MTELERTKKLILEARANAAPGDPGPLQGECDGMVELAILRQLCECGKPARRLMRGRASATCSSKCERRAYYVKVEKLR